MDRLSGVLHSGISHRRTAFFLTREVFLHGELIIPGFTTCANPRGSVV